MRNVYSVSQVNAYIRRMFGEDYLLQSILVRGEVSNCKYHSSGHIYFTLKDASGTLSCVMFAGRRRGLSFRMKEGDQVIVAGTVDVYARAGTYQLYAERIIEEGMGALARRYEELKRRLEESGMFSAQYKQEIPRYIHTLGVVTAPTGAAVRDIINISLRRDPYLQIILYPAIVQGDEAPASIIAGIRALDAYGVDTIIVGRGGGSIEDLWAFNEESVAEAVFDCQTPIISAVGHETDTVITDFVADLRAPTPSAAAELAVFDYRRFVQDLAVWQGTLQERMEKKLSLARQELTRDSRELQHLSPTSRLREQRMTAESLRQSLEASMAGAIGRARAAVPDEERFAGRMRQALLRARTGAERREQLDLRMRTALTREKNRLSVCAAQLEQRSPLAQLSGGYGYVTDEQERRVRSATQVGAGDRIAVRFADGRVDARVESVQVREKWTDGQEVPVDEKAGRQNG